MIAQIRTAMATVGGLKFLAAIASIGWGMSKLDQIVGERNAMLDAQAEMIAANEAALAASMQAHPSAKSLATGPLHGTFTAPAEEIAGAARALGCAYTGDWSAVDGKSLRDDLEALASLIEGATGLHDFRAAVGLCPAGKDHWADSDQSCCGSDTQGEPA
jgi:hypothetical protein